VFFSSGILQRIAPQDCFLQAPNTEIPSCIPIRPDPPYSIFFLDENFLLYNPSRFTFGTKDIVRDIMNPPMVASISATLPTPKDTVPERIINTPEDEGESVQISQEPVPWAPAGWWWELEPSKSDFSKEINKPERANRGRAAMYTLTTWISLRPHFRTHASSSLFSEIWLTISTLENLVDTRVDA
jgi:hypothetical protein